MMNYFDDEIMGLKDFEEKMEITDEDVEVNEEKIEELNFKPLKLKRKITKDEIELSVRENWVYESYIKLLDATIAMGYELPSEFKYFKKSDFKDKEIMKNMDTYISKEVEFADKIRKFKQELDYYKRNELNDKKYFEVDEKASEINSEIRKLDGDEINPNDNFARHTQSEIISLSKKYTGVIEHLNKLMEKEILRVRELYNLDNKYILKDNYEILKKLYNIKKQLNNKYPYNGHEYDKKRFESDIDDIIKEVEFIVEMYKEKEIDLDKTLDEIKGRLE